MDAKRIARANNGDELKDTLTNEMYLAVDKWWNRLGNNEREALRLLNNSPTIVSSLMFFEEDVSGFAFDYACFAEALKSKVSAISTANSKEQYSSFCDVCLMVSSYNNMAQEKVKIEQKIESLDLSPNLKEKVIEELVERSEDYKIWRKDFNYRLSELRKDMLWYAFKKVITGA